METGSRRWGPGAGGAQCQTGTVSVWEDEKVLEMMVVMAA